MHLLRSGGPSLESKEDKFLPGDVGVRVRISSDCADKRKMSPNKEDNVALI